ncbi:ABC transporter substrate-binding protein [Phreatobacter sp.]|uniref:ABC transporter substrate-binding protein n=1 Tax=Phreatobacter sp. TaxID=1966341 RepID=UPI003F70D4B8
MLSRTLLRALSLAFATVLACAVSAPASAQQRVVVGHPAPWNVQFAFFTFGEQLGYFREEGMALERVSVTGSAVLLPQVAAGQVHFGYANPDLAIIALARGEPMPLRFFMNWLRSQTFEFVVPEASPIQTLADLKGKKLGVGALTWGNLPLSRAMLASQNIAWQRDVEVLPVGLGAAAWRRMQTGEVDALNLFVGEHLRMELAGIKIRRLPMPEPFRSLFSNGWVASEQTLRDNPRLAIGFGRAMVKSWIACKANPEACVRSWWAAVPASRPAPAQEAAELATQARIVMTDRAQIDDFAAGAPRQYGHFPDGSWQRLIDVMRSEGQIQRSDLDLARLVTGDLLAEINRGVDPAAIEAAARAAR